MLKLAVVDVSAESRNKLFSRIGELLSSAPKELDFLPYIDLVPYALQELRFNPEINICIVGPELIKHDLTAIGIIRKSIGAIPLLVSVDREFMSLSLIEQYARYGADDVIAPETTPAEFIRKIVLLARKPQKKVSGKLVLVDSGKGGIGVTTIAVGLAEALAEREQKVTLVDLDTETQDLSRFVQARPFINENLQAILEGSKPLTQDSVNECLVNLFDDTGRVNCLPPIAECDLWYEAKSRYHRNFLSVLEILDATRSVVIVDVSSLRGALLRHLYRAADKVVYVLNNDAATLYAAVDRLHRLRNFLSPESQICILENASLKHGLPASLLRKEFLRAAQLEDSAWLTDSVPFCKFGYRWPGSGASIYSQGSEKIRSSLTALAKQIGLIEDQLSNRLISNWSFSKSLLSKTRYGSRDSNLGLLENKNETKKLPAPEPIDKGENLIFEEELSTPAHIEARIEAA